MASMTIYHNPRCSKSRQTLQIIQDRGQDVEIVEYLKTPPSVAELKSLLNALDMQPADIMRKKEAEFKQAGLDQQGLTEAQQLEAMTRFPKVIERPIVVKGNKAVVGRPPEKVLELF